MRNIMASERNLNNVRLLVSAGEIRQFPGAPVPQVALSGRSNVGKSSLINVLLEKKALARVSGAPGKTITVNFYDVDGKLLFVDLPGYGFARRPAAEKAKWSALTDGYFTGNKNIDRLALVLQLIDLKVGPTADDEIMLDYLVRAGLPFLVVATKADKPNKTERAAALTALENHPLVRGNAPVIPFSALTKEGKDALWRAIDRALSA